MKKIIYLITFIFSFSSFGATVLIDPGHGGVEFGAHRKFGKSNKEYKEKDIALILSKKIAKELKGEHSVYLTRSVDRTVSLQDRANMAEMIEADIFISVHLNSSASAKSSGFETYYLNNKKDAAVNKVELAENGSFVENNPTINRILIDLVVEQTVEKSKSLANAIHGKLKKTLPKRFGVPDRGIRSGLFYVLALSKRPAVLLEVGFLSNPKEIRKIMGSKFQNAYAKKVAKGIKEYLEASEVFPKIN